MLADELDYVIGVDTHRDEHVLAVTAPAGGVLARKNDRGGPAWLSGSASFRRADPSRRQPMLVRLGAHFDVEVRRVLPDLRLEIAQADCIVAMAGYNTVCDVLSYRRPAGGLTPKEINR